MTTIPSPPRRGYQQVDGRVTDVVSGETLWIPGDLESEKPEIIPRVPPTTQTPPNAEPSAAPRPEFNFDLDAGAHRLTPRTTAALRAEQDRYLSALSTAAPGFAIEVRHHDKDTWHGWGRSCAVRGCAHEPIWERSVLPNEVVLECDTEVRGADGAVDKLASYKVNREYSRRVVSVLARMTRYPGDPPRARSRFTTCLSGSKGIHLSVYLDLPLKTTAREARRIRTVVWIEVLRRAGYRVGTTPVGRPDSVADSDGTIVKWDASCVWWVKRRMLHCWGDLRRRTPYTWAGFRLPEEPPRELRMPPYPKRWDPLTADTIREQISVPDPSAVYDEDGADDVVLPPGSFDEAGAEWLVEAYGSPGPNDHDHALQTLALRLKGCGATYPQACAFFRRAWRPTGECSTASHRPGSALDARIRSFFESALVIRPKRWQPPEFVVPTDGSAPVVLPGMAKRTSDTECPFGVSLDRRYRHHRHGDTHHLIPYAPSCNNKLCPVHFARVAHRAAAVATEDLARLLRAPEVSTQRDSSLEEFNTEGAEGDTVGGGRALRSHRPVDQYAPAEDWKTRPVRMVISPPAGTTIHGVKHYRALRSVLEEVARSQGFLINRVFWHDRPGTRDVRHLCTKGWHLEIIGVFDSMTPKTEGDAWDEPVSGCGVAYEPIVGSVLQVVRSIYMTGAQVVDTLQEANLALQTGGQEGGTPPVDLGNSGGKGVSQVRFAVQADTVCHDLCPRPDHHPEPPPRARWCPLCPVAEAWIDRPEWQRVTFIGLDRPPDRPVAVDHERFVRDWRAIEPGWFHAPARHASGFDLATYEENYHSGGS